MAKTIFESSFSKLSGVNQELTSSWFFECAKMPEYNDIIENIRLQDILSDKTFFNFWNVILDKISSRLSLSKSITLAGKISYEEACKLFLFKGKTSSVHPKTTLYSIINEIDLKEIICTAMGYTDIDLAWDNFWDDVLDDEDRIAILANAGFSDWKFIIWVYFNPYLGEEGTNIDPLESKDVNHICTTLGLPDEWNKYKIGQNIWKLKMIAPESINRYVPSIADAGWNQYFQIVGSPKDKIKWGWTRPLKSPRGTRGMPEIIMKCWQPSKIKSVFNNLPDSLGTRTL